MTLPSVVSDLLMLAPSLSLVPLAPVESARSEPARSTRLILLTCSTDHTTHHGAAPAEQRPNVNSDFGKPSPLVPQAQDTEKHDPRVPSQPRADDRTFSPERFVSLSKRFCEKRMVKTAWDRELVSFMFVAATVLQYQFIFTQSVIHSITELSINQSVYLSVNQSFILHQSCQTANNNALHTLAQLQPHNMRTYACVFECVCVCVCVCGVCVCVCVCVCAGRVCVQ